MSFWRRVVLAVVYACVIAAALLVATPSVAAPSPGSQTPEPDLGAILLDSRDVPPGFELDAKQSRSYEESPAAPSWLSPIMQHAAHIHGYDRYWFHRPERRAIIAQVIEYPIDSLASASTHSFAQDLKNKAATEFSITAVPYARGFILEEGYGGAPAVHGIFVHGPRAFIITVITRGKASAEVELIRRLVEIQAGKAPPGPTELRDLGEAWLAAGTALGTLGAAAAYVGGLSLVAWLRDPLRRHPTGPAPQPMAQLNTTTVDVTAQARRRRRRAAAGLVLELSGAGVAVAGLLPFTWPLGLFLVVLGIGMAWLPRLLFTATVHRAASESELWTGRRRLRVTCYAAMSTVCVISGLLIMVLYGVGAVMTSPSYDYNIRFFVIGAALLAVGTLIRRRARRLAALNANEVLRRDPRPMVLYLRKFAEDSLAIRTATYARRFFVDRLSPRRFERFEEILVRNLTTIGPVVALNPSGTDLAPIGAARETLAADHWQQKIAGWMAEAQLIVVGAAPETTSEGFEWELREIDSQELWSKTLLVLPPVPDVTMRARWDRFTKVFTDTAMARHPIPSDPARTLALLGSPTAGWSAITADQRTEWTYAEALVASATMATSMLAQQRGG